MDLATGGGAEDWGWGWGVVQGYLHKWMYLFKLL